MELFRGGVPAHGNSCHMKEITARSPPGGLANNACVRAGSNGEGDDAAGMGCVCQRSLVPLALRGPLSSCRSSPASESLASLSASGPLSPASLSLSASLCLPALHFLPPVSLSVCPPPHCSVSHLVPALISPFPRSGASLPLSLSPPAQFSLPLRLCLSHDVCPSPHPMPDPVCTSCSPSPLLLPGPGPLPQPPHSLRRNCLRCWSRCLHAEGLVPAQPCVDSLLGAVVPPGALVGLRRA